MVDDVAEVEKKETPGALAVVTVDETHLHWQPPKKVMLVQSLGPWQTVPSPLALLEQNRESTWKQ
jgi:hypothetical protein